MLKMTHFLLLETWLGCLKNRFRLVIIIPGKPKYILLNKNVRTCNYLQRFAGSPWLSFVILCYTWLYLVILGYTWLSLVIPGYIHFKYM